VSIPCLKMMTKCILCIAVIILFSFPSAGQTDSLQDTLQSVLPVTNKYFKSGNNELTLSKYSGDSTKSYLLLSLHHNEQTAIEEAKYFISGNGGMLYELENEKQRNITATIKGEKVVFDPNRIFTMRGRSESIKSKTYRKSKLQYVLSFSWFILSAMPEDKIIIAVHNNADEGFSIHSYRKGGSLAKDAKDVYLNTAMDPDDFFLTTDEGIFEKIKNEDYSVVLQSKTATDDGSLSIYCGKISRKYINVETEHGHAYELKNMLRVIDEILQ